MSWVSLALALVKLANLLLDRAGDAARFKAGEDAELARASQAVLRRTEAGKKLMERLDALGDRELDDLLRDLGR